MNINIFRGRRLAVAGALLMLTCAAPSRAWCASNNLWVAFDNGAGIGTYTPAKLAKSGVRTPVYLDVFPYVTGLAFDKSHNLWAVVQDNEVVQFTPAQLGNLKHNPSPTPAVIITSTAFNKIIGCNFDPKGNLWVVDGGNNSLDELSKAQLAAGTGPVTPHFIITSSDLNFPSFVTFDKAGNAWVDSKDNSELAEFSTSQLTSSGAKSPAILLSDDGSGTSLNWPGEIAFDKSGNLWVPNYLAETVVEYAKDQLTTSGSPVPVVKLSSSVFIEPWGAAFDASGDLVVMNYSDGTIAKFTPKQLKTTGLPVPKVTVTGIETENSQIIFGPAS